MKNNGLILQYYAVFYLDILNQREKIKEISEIPKTEEEKKLALEKMRGSYGLIIQIRDAINSLISMLNQRSVETPKEYHGMIGEIEGNPLRVHRIGDAFAIYFPLGSEKGKIAIFGVNKLMMAAAGIHLMSLSIGVPVRGSIAIGLCMEIGENELYGPALVRAYDIEQRDAEWMRVVVDPSVVEFINDYNLSDKGMIPKTVPDKIGSYLHDSCVEFIEIDHDGRYILDFLQPESLRNIPESEAVIKAAKKFLDQEYKRFKETGHDSTNAARIAHKYKMTLDYFIAHT
jgi:hypothetical protein